MIIEYIDYLISLSMKDKIMQLIVLVPITLGLWRLVNKINKYNKEVKNGRNN